MYFHVQAQSHHIVSGARSAFLFSFLTANDNCRQQPLLGPKYAYGRAMSENPKWAEKVWAYNSGKPTTERFALMRERASRGRKQFAQDAENRRMEAAYGVRVPLHVLGDERRARDACIEAICGGALPPLERYPARMRLLELRRLAEVACSPPPPPKGRWTAEDMSWGAAVRAQACLELAAEVRCSERNWANTSGLDQEWRRLVARAVQETARDET